MIVLASALIAFWVLAVLLFRSRLVPARLAVSARVSPALVAAPTYSRPPATSYETRRWALRPSDVLLPVALGTWMLAVHFVDLNAIDDWGLLPALPVAFYVALGLLVLSIVLTLVDARLSPVRLALHLVALVVVLHGTVPMIFSDPTYPWVYKHIGVTSYIAAHGRLNPSVDIYQNWPGFFALAAWFTKVAGAGTALAFAKWAPLYFNLVICLELAFVFRWLPVDRRVAWLAMFLFVGGNWVGQDYFAPQALAFVLSMAVFGLILALFQTDRIPMLRAVAARLTWRRVQPATARPPASTTGAEERAPLSGWPRQVAVGMVFTIYAVVVVTHQLSPYMVLLGVAVLVHSGLIRPWWILAVFAALAVGFFALHYTFLRDNGDLLGSPLSGHDLFHVLSNPFDNAHSIKSSGASPMTGRRITALGAPALILGLWMAAALGAVRRFRLRQPTLMLALLAGAPTLLAFVQNYGGEAIFRIYLFSLPWTVVLTACLVAPRWPRWGVPSAVGAGVGLALVLALFMSAFYGSVELYRVRPGEVAAAAYFYDHAAPKSGLGLIAPNVPTKVGASYDQFVKASAPEPLSNLRSFQHRMLGPADVERLSALYADHADGSPGGMYLFLSTDQAVYTEVLGLMPQGALASLDRALAQSPQWRPFYRSRDATIYQFVGAAAPPSVTSG